MWTVILLREAEEWVLSLEHLSTAQMNATVREVLAEGGFSLEILHE